MNVNGELLSYLSVLCRISFPFFHRLIAGGEAWGLHSRVTPLPERAFSKALNGVLEKLGGEAVWVGQGHDTGLKTSTCVTTDSSLGSSESTLSPHQALSTEVSGATPIYCTHIHFFIQHEEVTVIIYADCHILSAIIKAPRSHHILNVLMEILKALQINQYHIYMRKHATHHQAMCLWCLNQYDETTQTNTWHSIRFRFLLAESIVTWNETADWLLRRDGSLLGFISGDDQTHRQIRGIKKHKDRGDLT